MVLVNNFDQPNKFTMKFFRILNTALVLRWTFRNLHLRVIDLVAATTVNYHVYSRRKDRTDTKEFGIKSVELDVIC